MVGNNFPDFLRLLSSFLQNFQTFQEISRLFHITMKMMIVPDFQTQYKPRYYFGRCLSELAQLVPLPYSLGRSSCYSDRLHDFSAIIPNVTTMSLSTVYFLLQLDSRILCIKNAFIWPMI